MSVRFALLIALLSAASSGAQSRSAVDERLAAGVASMRNPQRLRAVQLLDQQALGVAPRVRFQWDQVPGAVAYVLMGQWTTPTSWTVRSHEYRVTQRSATRWKSDQVCFEASLPVGAHSWRVVAIFGPNDAGDFEHPAQLSFELR
jgi:hypothetical protein